MAFRHYTVDPFFFPLGLTGRRMHALFPELDAVSCKPSKQATRTMKPNYISKTDDDGTFMDIEFPGVAPEKVEVEVKDGILTVTGKRFDGANARQMETKGGEARMEEEETEAKDASHADKEPAAEEKNNAEPSPSVIYALKVRLGPNAHVEGMKALNVGNGVLHIAIPVKPEVRKIEIM